MTKRSTQSTNTHVISHIIPLSALLYCGAVSCEAVESQIVGYQDKVTGAFSPISASFIPVAGEEKWTFADYKVNCDEDDPESQTGWIANNDSFNTYTPEGGFDKAFIYCPAWLSAALTEAFQYDVPVGWYDQEDQEFTKCYNTEPITFGKGTIAKASTATAKVTFAGQVKDAPTVTDIGAFTIAGNSSAVDRYIGEIIVNCDEDDPESQTGWIANNDSINVYTAEGGFDKAFIYCPAWLSAALTEAFQYDVPVGWYDQEDQEFTKCYNTERKFVAGEGFVAKASTPTATVTIKSALAKDDE